MVWYGRDTEIDVDTDRNRYRHRCSYRADRCSPETIVRNTIIKICNRDPSILKVRKLRIKIS